jgi:hypothetical protein
MTAGDLEHSLSTLNLALNFAIGAVVLGLLLEYIPEILSLHGLKSVVRLGAVLVIAGVAGELGLHIRSEQIDEQLKAQQKTTIAQLLDRATAAEKATALALERAATAEKSAAELKLQLARLNADRFLTTDQLATLHNVLSPYRGNTFWIVVEKGKEDVDSEQELLAKQLTAAFIDAGWTKEIHWSAQDKTKEDREFLEVSNRGCLIDYSAGSTSLGQLVAGTLHDFGIVCKPFVGAEIIPNHVILTVALR